MIGKKARIQLAVFLVIAVVGVVYAGGRYAGLGRYFGFDGYDVTLHLSSSGGIFRNAEVTYRGYPVGRVTGLHITDAGLDVTLTVEGGAPPIPASSRAVVADRSAVGEQYVDLRPPNNQGPYLHQGSEIESKRTTVPPTPQSMLRNLDELARSVPEGSLRTVVDEAGKAFRGTGPDLRRLLDTANSFTAAAEQHVPQTRSLLSDARTVLGTQQQQSANLERFSSGLDLISKQLQQSDPDLRTILQEGPGAARSLDKVLRNSGNDLSILLANLLTVTQTAEPRTANLEQLLVGLPIIGGFSPALARGGTAHLAIVANFYNPPPCTRGYGDTQEEPGASTDVNPTNWDAYCAEPKGSPIEVRGAQNAPYKGVPDPARPGAEQQERQQDTGRKVSDDVPAGINLPGVLGELGGHGADNLGSLMGVSE